MRRWKRTVILPAAALALLLGACDQDRAGADKNLKTSFPGQVSAGGGTSGEALGRSRTTQAQMPAGTPGIPQGNEGNVGGTAMGGTTAAGAATKVPPAASAPASAPDPAAAKAKAEAQAALEKQKLAESMETVASHWRKQAAAKGWEAHPQVPVAAAKGIGESAAQSGASGQPGGRMGAAAAEAPIRSEKAGTAPPSKDAKPDNPVSIRAPEQLREQGQGK
jgi:hypothetical protein